MADSPLGTLNCEVLDPSGRPVGWVCIDTTIQGHSHGGLRLALDVSPLELQRLARRMTLKFGFLGLPSGGAKAGVLGDPDAPAEQRWERLQQFATGLSPVLQSRVYQPWPDLGTSEAEINQLLTTLGMPRHRHDPSRTDSGLYTSLTVVAAVQVAAQQFQQQLGGMTAAVQGFGKVGSTVAQGLVEQDVRVIAISTSQGALYQPYGLPIATLTELARRSGPGFVQDYQEAEHISQEELLALPVDVLCPCATSDTIHAGNVQTIQARIISPGANCPVSDEAEQMLLQRGVLSLPDFITNCGGVLGGTMAFAGLDLNSIRQCVAEQLAPRLAELIASHWDRGELLSVAAAQQAVERLWRIKAEAEQPRLLGRVLQAGTALYRHGFVPQCVMRRWAAGYFAARVREHL